MSAIDWKDEHKVNVVEIDRQHQRILELVNQLHQLIDACVEKKELLRNLIVLVEYTRMHFSTEEKLMKQHNFPGRLIHQKEHRTLLKHLDSLIASVSNGNSPTIYSDYDVSSDWAILHILEYDRSLGAFLNSQNIF